jgi:hypothetical protein
VTVPPSSEREKLLKPPISAQSAKTKLGTIRTKPRHNNVKKFLFIFFLLSDILTPEIKSESQPTSMP